MKHKKKNMFVTDDKYPNMTVNPCSFTDFGIFGEEEGDCHGSFLGRFREVESKLQRHTDKDDLIEEMISDLEDIKKGNPYRDGYHYRLGELYENLIYLGDLVGTPLEDGIQTIWNRTKFWNVIDADDE